MYCSTCQPTHLLLLFGSPPKGLVFFFFPCANNIESRSLQNLTARAVLCQGARRATAGLPVAAVAPQGFVDTRGGDAVAPLSLAVRAGAGAASTAARGQNGG